MWRTRTVWAELDSPLAQLVLDLIGEELLATIGLEALDGEWHLGGHAREEVAGVGGGPAGIEAEDLEAGTIVDGRVLVEAGPDLAGIHLHPVSGNRPAIAPGTLPPQPWSLELVLAVADQPAPCGWCRAPALAHVGERARS